MGPGREAATVRHVLLVLVLVAASFLGGAFVNGPGLRWVQTQLLGSLGLSDGGEIAAVDLKTVAGPERAGEGSRAGPSSPEPVRGPVAPVPAVISDGPTGLADPSDARSRRPAGTAGAGAAAPASPATTSPPLTGPLASAGPGPRSDRGTTPSGAAAPPASARAAAPLDPSLIPAVEPSPPAAPAVPAPRDPGVMPAVQDSLASLMPAGAPPPPPAPPAPDSSSPRSSPPPQGESRPEPAAAQAHAGGDQDWAALGRTMQSLGISRFSIEGQPGGRVVFSCLIPLAGRQAVAQRFEAEGDDGLLAARAALRRVALWRATQN